jgi:ornithine--oxo-acid transaminase
LKPGQHGSTFGGNPLACSVARAALRGLVKEKMVENASEMGAYFLSKLKTIQNKTIKDIRGRGLMIAIELHEGTEGGARRVAEELKTLGILCKETHTHILRFAPPLIINKQEIEWAFKKIEQVFK